MSIDRESWIRLVCSQYAFHGVTRGIQRRITERTLRKNRSESGSVQQAVSFSQWNVELFGEVQDHVAAWLRSPRFDEAQVPLTRN